MILPVTFKARNLITDVVKDKGSKLAFALMLDQYRNSPNFNQYLASFIDEMDYLFEQIDSVYLGRTLEYAVGKQLDVIGIILNQPRSVEIPYPYFGFVGAANAQKMSDEATPNDGGYFLSEEGEGFNVVPLNDYTYRRLLLAKALCSTRDTLDINDTYLVICTLLDKVPRGMSLTWITPREVVLDLSALDVSDGDSGMIQYLSRWFIPTGTSLTINLI